ncbi:cation diffusion facilitator family transporter [bacterium]|nr:cation diffusion facilitator family transporter [Rubripirellula sp.]MDB4353179.1 cation diffusion facilitator family transporter [bacterium]MDB4624796.1 cation diffusion facilitator family transporter [Rubripirellula sp.]
MHQCAHHHTPDQSYGWAFSVGVILNLGFVCVEAFFGWYTGSLALLADAGHNLSDVLGLLVAWGGYALAKLPPSPRRTYGWRGSTILGAVFNGLLLLIAVGGIAWEAIGRLSDPTQIPAGTVIGVAMVGVLINTGTALLFVRGRNSDLNIRGAYLHMAADALLSLGVVFAGVVIMWTQWSWVDPVSSLVIAAVIFLGTWGLLKDSVHLALQAVPPNIDFDEVQSALLELPNVTEVHDLHVWAVSTTEVAMTAHVVRPNLENDDAMLKVASDMLHSRFQIDHTTIQIERSISEADCGQAKEGTL